MIVATAGHIDHGKTTLVKALTGVDTDRLPEEKKRGISIDLGFAYRKTPAGDVIGFVDVPGHERFVRNMLAGVCGIDYVMLIVAADDGVMPQTIEHLHIVDLLTIKHGIAVITKTDRVPAERVAEVSADVRSLLASTALANIDVLPVSAVSGDGVETLRQVLGTAASEFGNREHAGRNLRYAIDRVFTIAGSGTVVTGTLFNGAVAVGDKLVISPSGREVRVRGIQKDGQPATQAIAGERCALNLTGAEVADIHRGDWVVAPAIHAPTQRLDVRLQLLASETQPLKHWTPVHLHLGTADVTARIAIRRGASVAPGTSAIVQIITDKPLAALNGDRFILRDQSAMRTIGGGTVIDPFPATRRNAQVRMAQLGALENADPAAALAALLAGSPAGVDLVQFERTFNLTAERAAALTQAADIAIVGKETRVALPRAVVDSIKKSAVEALTRLHRESPQATGFEIATLRKQLAPALSAATFTAVLRELGDEKKLEIAGSTARLPKHVATDNPADEKMWQALKPILDNAGFNVLPLRELAPASNIKEPILKDFLHRKARTGEIIRVTPERFYPRATLAQLAAVAQVVAQAVPAGFSAAQFRDRSGVGRGLAIEILECLDRLGITQRIGDVRKMRKDFVPILGDAVAPPAPAVKPQTAAKPSPQPARRNTPPHFRR
ncbi:MAG: selenocysteine-specific translation elongation factor [Betaproteobacteria bacterium]|nr:selenocysteine-specific translation elongation factor [Betaproteobacteria bacterium]